MIHARTNLADGTIELTITIAWDRISSAYDTHIQKQVDAAELPGFRKGKAPRKLVEEKLDKNKIYEEVIQKILPIIYQEVLTEEKIKPITSPKIELVSAQEGNDWQIKAQTCERPVIKVGDYKEAITKLKAGKKPKIWVPGQESEKEKEKDDKPTLDELLNTIYPVLTITIPALLIEHEVNHQLTQLIDQTKKLGLTVEQYLASSGRSAESLKAEYTEQAKKQITLEIGLDSISDLEKISVEEEDIAKVIAGGKTEEEKTALTKQRYYIASVLRRQKTLDRLASL